MPPVRALHLPVASLLPRKRRASVETKPLFVAGSPRSGTTGLIKYLNLHPEIVICRERYKYVSPRRITPELFDFERILDFRERETNQSREAHVELLAGKDPDRVRWVGDKYPLYFERLRTLASKNPGAHFLVLYRPVEEVAESFEARASNPKDGWPERNGFAAGIRIWNASLQRTRAYIESTPRPRLLIVDYHRFFGAGEAYVPLLSGFLDIELDDGIRRRWARMSEGFAQRRRPKALLSPQHEELVRRLKDHATEAWIRERIERQEAAGATSGAPIRTRARRTLSARIAELRGASRAAVR
jgi:hypothetical protein